MQKKLFTSCELQISALQTALNVMQLYFIFLNIAILEKTFIAIKIFELKNIYNFKIVVLNTKYYINSCIFYLYDFMHFNLLLYY